MLAWHSTSLAFYSLVTVFNEHTVTGRQQDVDSGLLEDTGKSTDTGHNDLSTRVCACAHTHMANILPFGKVHIFVLAKRVRMVCSCEGDEFSSLQKDVPDSVKL